MFTLDMISPCKQNDMEEIFRLYQWATELQKAKGMVQWPSFPRSLVEQEIEEGRIWKLSLNDITVCVWSITFNDPQIWEEKDKGDAIYIHRITTRPEYRGNNLVELIVAWSRWHAISLNKKFIRLDTLGQNKKLIEVYTGAGFTFLGTFHLKNTVGLPDHYQKNKDCLLFELSVH